MLHRGLVVLAVVTITRLAAGTAVAQLPIGAVPSSGQPVYPVFEGWYRNPDGSFSISFGYFNRNAEETLEIPPGPENFISPGDANQGQPSHFEPRRHWGVFAVKVPTDFTGQVVWTIKVRGQTIAIPGSLHPNWQIDALEGEAGSGNTPPVIKFDLRGAEGAGPGGITTGPLNVRVGRPLVVAVWARDDGKSSSTVAGERKASKPVTLQWFKHQGPGAVAFGNPTPDVGRSDGKATTTVTFSTPGEYVLRVRVNDASGVASAGHAQCCWTNGFVKVIVTP